MIEWFLFTCCNALKNSLIYCTHLFVFLYIITLEKKFFMNIFHGMISIYFLKANEIFKQTNPKSLKKMDSNGNEWQKVRQLLVVIPFFLWQKKLLALAIWLLLKSYYVICHFQIFQGVLDCYWILLFTRCYHFNCVKQFLTLW